MEIRIIEERIKRYQPVGKVEELDALKEIIQEITLSALSRAEFFKYAAFQGETCLRIVHGLNRFSENLDFVLFEPKLDINWGSFFHEIELAFKGYGFEIQSTDGSRAGSVVKNEDSFSQVLKLLYKRTPEDVQVINIKLEIYTNPGGVPRFETKILRFPEPFSVVVKDIPSLFASKVHVLLCRQYVQGRDWFDFLWYVEMKNEINLQDLQAALRRQGPWKGDDLVIDIEWVKGALREKVELTDWEFAKKDAAPFLGARERGTLDLWEKEFFLESVDLLSLF